MQENFTKKTVFLYFYCFYLVFALTVLTPALALNTEEYKITVTNMDDQQNFIGGFQLNPISLSIVDELYDIEHIEEIVPVVLQPFRTVQGDRPPINFSEYPPQRNSSFKDIPPDWNGTRPERNLDDGMTNMFDFIIEAVDIDSLNSFTFYDLPDEIISGYQLDKNDSSVVFIGEDAQSYFNVSINGIITIDESNFTVIGVFSDKNFSKYVFMNITEARVIIGLESNEYNTVYIYVENEDYLQSVSEMIKDIHPELMTQYLGSLNYPYQPPSWEDPSNSADNTELKQTPGFEIVTLLLALTILFTISYYLREKKP